MRSSIARDFKVNDVVTCDHFPNETFYVTGYRKISQLIEESVDIISTELGGYAWCTMAGSLETIKEK